MSRETILDEAIAKAKENEDWQLVEWLRMARCGESAARWYSEKLRELEDENAKLRDEIDQWHRLTAGIELPEYPITEFQPKDLERENAKLRELVQFANKVVGGLCEIVENSPGCFMCQLNQDDDRMCGASELYDRMHELGVDA